MNKIKKRKETATVFLIGGIIYAAIELLFRKRTHWTMVIVGGTCFTLLYRIFNNVRFFSRFKKCAIGSGVITTIEFISGCIINKLLKWNVWDYSKLRGNILGQVCLLYSVFWALLCLPAIKVSELIKKRWF